MSFLELLLLSFGLAADATAVSITSGSVYRKARPTNFLTMALFFGFFQAAMPVLGYFFGTAFANVIKDFDHWVAFILLAIIGGKMIYESMGAADSNNKENANFCTLRELFILAFATSIDALAVGITFSIIKTDLFFSVSVVGSITFICSMIGAILGKRIGKYLSNKIEIIGGIILILIGFKILISHLLS